MKHNYTEMEPDLDLIAEARHIEKMQWFDDLQKARELGLTVNEYRRKEYQDRFGPMSDDWIKEAVIF